MRFLDLFMVWCALADAPEMSRSELACTRVNWNRVILEGRKTGLTLGIGCETAQVPLLQVGKDLFRDLKRVAQTLDSINGGEAYQKVCDELVACFDNPDRLLCPYLKVYDWYWYWRNRQSVCREPTGSAA
ncbi:hypothetical protein ACLK1S_16565 [Escherichia coli]